jgi:hypothetical protein
MSKGNCSSEDIGLFLRNIEEFHIGEADHCEGFVEFKEVDVLDFEACLFEGVLGGVVGSDGEIDGFGLCVSVTDDLCQGFDTQFLDFGLRHEDDRTCSIIDFGGVSGSDGAGFTERGLQLRYFGFIILFRLFVFRDDLFAHFCFDGN